MFKKFFLLAVFLISAINISNAQEQSNKWAVDFARSFAHDIFETNGIPYVKPMVEIVNATSNSRFFNSAFVPSDNKFYAKFGLHFMFGFVREDMKSYNPTVPSEPFDFQKAIGYLAGDTSQLMYYLFKTVIHNGVTSGRIKTPEKAATVLGRDRDTIKLEKEVLRTLAQEHPLWPFLTEALRDSVMNVIDKIPTNNTLPEGGNIDYIFAGVPQIEIGSFYGTELLLRYIPEIDMGSNIGKLSFWGVGLKHSISQYFKDIRGKEPFHLAIQGTYQGTKLTNEIGIIKAQMNSKASFWSFNIHSSYQIKNIVEVYGGVGYENIGISTEYTYTLPIEQQIQLGLLEPGHTSPTPGYPGDTKPQTSYLDIFDNNFKLVFGLNKRIWNFEIFADYNISQFNIFTAGIKYTFK